mgnify:CR=1 FL=1|jgi:hypothetical protein
MASVINRTTLSYLRSVNTLLYPSSEWEINPDMSQVEGVAPKYWKWDSGTSRPIAMDAGEQAAYDIARIESQRDAIATQLDRTEDLLRSFALLMVSEFNKHTDTVNAILDAVDSATSLADFKASVAPIADIPTRSMDQFKTAMRNNLGT